MPVSRKEVKVTITTGDIAVSLDPATANVQTFESDQLAAGTTVISPGAYLVKVFNTGINNITVNTEVIAPADEAEFVARENPVNNRMDFTPEITVVVPAGGSAFYTANRPSS